MDEFDIIDLVYKQVASAATGLEVIKYRSATGISTNHIVISHLQLSEDDFENELPVNVNIFIRNYTNGMPNIALMKTVKRKVRDELLKITIENGQYRDIKIEGSVPFLGVKDGFTCVSIKVIIKTDN